MHLFLFTDIFGVTPEIIVLHQHLKLLFDKVSILDPYAGIEYNFSSEQQAYSEFIRTSGHEQYLKRSRRIIKQSNEVNCLLGFSAGASVCWRLSEELDPKNTQQIIAFYPSQIRHHLYLKPVVKTAVIFPKAEPLFSVEESISTLNTNKNVSCYQSRYSHGFMNPASSGYSEEAADEYSNVITESSFFNNPLVAIKESNCG